MLARVLYRDGLMLVIDKPAGLAVHRGPKGGESLEDYFDALRFGLPRAPALAHRLDRETSGCLVLGRHRKALARSACCSSTAASARPIGRWSRAGPPRTKAASTCRSAARRDPRLVDEARSGGPAGGDEMEGDGAGASSYALAGQASPRPAPGRLPSPLGRGWGWGSSNWATRSPIASRPSPSLPRKGGGEQT